MTAAVKEKRGQGTSAPLTAEQQAALAARDRSVALAAGAGCGKTFVLTERFLAEIDPTSLDADAQIAELVAITFTDAAAREMRDRIRKQCFKRLAAAADPDEAAAWQRLVRSIDGARISTIHAFCTALLRRRAVEAGVDPQFTVLDAPAAELLRLETVDDCLRNWLIERNDDALDLAAAYGLERLRADLTRVCQPRTGEAIGQWRDASAASVVAAWKEFHENEVVAAALAALRQNPAVVQLRTRCDALPAKTEQAAGHKATLAAVLDQLMSAEPSELPAILADLRPATIIRSVQAGKHWHDPADYEAYKTACEAVRKLVDKELKLAVPLDDAACLAAAERGLALTRLAAGVLEEIEAVKASRGQLEFDDLLLRTHRLLTDPAHADVRRHESEGTRLVMVDEFQDTNPLQLDIACAIAGEDWRTRGLFAVGDFKQSIYAFQGAEPKVSRELRDKLPDESRLSLTTNFRSQPAILEFVNALFVDEMAGYEPLVPHRPQATPTPAIEFLWTPAVEEPGDDDASAAKLSAGDARRAEAQRIARRLRQLFESQAPIVVDPATGGPRPVKPGDVAILFRALSDVQHYEEGLRAEGLEYYLAGGHAFYSQQEIYDVLNLLRAVDSAIDEIALAGALRSPIFSLADEALYWLARRRKSLGAAIADPEPLPSELSAEEAAKVRHAAKTLARLRAEKGRLLVAELLELAFALTGYDATIAAEFLGERKAANLAKLVENARTLDRTSPGDLHGYITQLAEFVARQPKEPPAATQTAGDVIRLMTIHNAKGLEFPLVVLPDLERGSPPGSSDALIDLRLGPLVGRLDGEDDKLVLGITLSHRVEQQREQEERVRLFYVACTRAADGLILSSAIKDPDKPAKDLLQLVARRFNLADGSLAAPLPAGYNAPAIRVTREEPPALGDAAAARGANLERLVIKTRELAKGGGQLPSTVAPIPVDSPARRRFSFSRLSGLLAPLPLGVDNFEAEGEAFDQLDVEELATPVNDDAHGRQFGALVHAILERVDFRDPRDVRGLADFLAPQFVAGDPRDAAASAAGLVMRFLASPRAAELAAATTVRREVEFLLPWPPGGDPDSRSAGRYLHGFIDCLYQDAEGAWRLLDYKSNLLGASAVERAAAMYDRQLLAYTMACEAALGERLAEVALVLLHPGVERQFAWSKAQRQTAIDSITAAMDAYVKPGQLPR